MRFRSFEVDTIIVLDQERLYNELVRDSFAYKKATHLKRLIPIFFAVKKKWAKRLELLAKKMLLEALGSLTMYDIFEWKTDVDENKKINATFKKQILVTLITVSVLQIIEG